MKRRVRKIGFLEGLGILIFKGMYVSKDDFLNGDQIISIKDDLSTEEYISKMVKYNAVVRELKAELSGLVTERNLLLKDNKLCEQKIKDATKSYSIKNKEMRLKNDSIRKENYKLKREAENIDVRIKVISDKYEKQLFNKREENRKLQQEINDVRYMGASSASAILKGLSKLITNRKFIEFRKAIRGLELRNNDLEEALVRCKSKTKM